MKQYLDTILPELKNVTRLFSLPDEVWEGEQPRFAFAAEETDGRYTCRATGDGHEAVLTAEIPDDADERIRELHRKRAARRLVKQTAYDLCRKATGIHPPWGSLTGIRPTHLIYEAMSEGIAPEEAAVRACTINPACALGVQSEVGSITTGKQADFVVCSPDYAKKRVYLAGKLV